jgi:hypothetical protein
MKRSALVLISSMLVAAIAPFAIAQGRQAKPDPTPVSDVLGKGLIAWSEFQKPKPLLLAKDAGSTDAASGGQAFRQTDTTSESQPVQTPTPKLCHSSSTDKLEPCGK